MASSIIHLAVTNELIKRHDFQNPTRLKLGCILPDYGVDGNSHLHVKTWGLNKKTYDFDEYGRLFGELIQRDDLYLGYYLHLVQDILYRHFVYDKYHWNPFVPGHVEKLHMDYRIGNCYVIRKYRLQNDIVISEGLDQEPLNALCRFDTDWLLNAMNEYFMQDVDGEIFFFTKEMTDEYIALTVEFCLAELDRMDREGGLMDAYENAWFNRAKSLLETTLNTRDLGMYRIEGMQTDDADTYRKDGIHINGKDSYTKTGRILRSDLPKNPSERDIAFLRDSDITTVIDLRDRAALAACPHGLAGREGFTYHSFPIEEGSGIPESVEAVPGSYLAIAESKGLTDVFRCMAESQHGILFNCSAGKDRSGVVSALLLLLCGVRQSDVVFDYMVTKQCNQARFELIRERLPELDMNIVIPQEKYMTEFMSLLFEKYGSIENYYLAMGINERMQEKIRRTMGTGLMVQ